MRPPVVALKIFQMVSDGKQLSPGAHLQTFLGTYVLAAAIKESLEETTSVETVTESVVESVLVAASAYTGERAAAKSSVVEKSEDNILNALPGMIKE